MHPRKAWLNAGIVGSLVLMISPACCFFWGMRSAFATLGSSGIGDLSALVGGVREMHVAMLACLPTILAAATLLIWCVLQRRKLRVSPPPLPPQTA